MFKINKLNACTKNFVTKLNFFALHFINPDFTMTLMNTTIHATQAEIILYTKINLYEKYHHPFQEK